MDYLNKQIKIINSIGKTDVLDVQFWAYPIKKNDISFTHEFGTEEAYEYEGDIEWNDNDFTNKENQFIEKYVANHKDEILEELYELSYD